MCVARWFVGESEKVDPAPNFCKEREGWGRLKAYVTGAIIVGGAVHHSRHRRWTQAGTLKGTTYLSTYLPFYDMIGRVVCPQILCQSRKTRNIDAETLDTKEKKKKKKKKKNSPSPDNGKTTQVQSGGT
ncbi:hypothetical protein GE21DRAFT_1341389 [Neurospora crassa]|nr:hypothetical protein GE21DRAFT_1341389 [Neurospora crassa]